MVRQLGMDKSLAVKSLRESGYSERAIARMLGISRNAVRNHIEGKVSKGTKAPTGEAPTGSEHSKGTIAPTGSEAPTSVGEEAPSRSLCEPFREVILSKLEQGLHRKRIFQDLVEEHGFSGQYWSVRRFITALGKDNKELPFRRIEVEPGAELQVDFGQGRPWIDATGKKRRSHVFRAVLSYSRKGYTEVVPRQTTEHLIRVLENAFWKLGGVPKVVVFDNAKCAVNKADWYDPEIQPKLLEFCKHYGCVFLPTKPRTPRHKGKVERGVDYVQENALRGHDFHTIAQQNQHLDRWEQSIADTRIHGTTKQHVRQVFEQIEKPCLKPLPADRFPFYHEKQRKVYRDGHIAVDNAYYSVPPEYLGRTVWVHWNSQTVRILNKQMETIALHAKKEAGRFSTLHEHIASEKIHSVERGTEYLLRKVRFLGPAATRWAEAVVAQRGIHAPRVLQGLLTLSSKHSYSVIDRACQVAWSSNALNYRVIKRLADDQSSASPQQTMEFMEEHPIIRSVSEYQSFVKAAIQGSEVQ